MRDRLFGERSSDDSPPDRFSDSLPPAMERQVALLRAEPPLREEWRAETVRRAAAARRRRITLTLPAAIAAGIFCAVAGGTLTFVASHARPRAAQAIAAQAISASGATHQLLPVRFSVVAPAAASVSIVGDFNHWDPATLPMRRSADGRTWEVEVRLPLGRYSYAYLVDGKLATDPAAPRGASDDFGTPNSVIMVHGT
ncbi:MAG TPA: isoamylase early set domain-containing protein [Gemmatimonadaceae bacterium]|jgi:hypothetical protein|nr:isoamylase early set domain-containing protein [Gemmatimonadaceae bacterium]